MKITIFHVVISVFAQLMTLYLVESKYRDGQKPTVAPELSFEPSEVISVNTLEYENWNKTESVFFVFFYKKTLRNLKIYNKTFNLLSLKVKEKYPFVKFFRVESVEKKLIKYFNIYDFPIFYWVNKPDLEGFEYEGKRRVSSMYNFINRQLNQTTRRISEITFFEKKKSGIYLLFIGSHQVFAKEYKTIVKEAREHKLDGIYHTNAPSLLENFKINNASYDCVVFKKRKGILDLGEKIGLNGKKDVRRSKIAKLLDIYTKDPYSFLNERRFSNAIFHKQGLPTFVLMLNGNETQKTVNLFYKFFKKTGAKHRKRLSFHNSTVTSRYFGILNNVFNYTISKLPKLVFFRTRNYTVDDVEKFEFPFKIINEKNLDLFIKAVNNPQSNQKLYKKSRRLYSEAENPEHTVKIVGTNFFEKVFNHTTNDVVLLICTKMSNVCKEMNDRYMFLIKRLKLNTNISFHYIDSYFNEVTHIRYKTIPTVCLIPWHNSTAERIKNVKIFKKRLTIDNLEKFIRKHAKNHLINDTVSVPNENDFKRREEEVKIKYTNILKILRAQKNEITENIGLRRILYHQLSKSKKQNLTEEDLDDIYSDKRLKKKIEIAAKKIKDEL